MRCISAIVLILSVSQTFPNESFFLSDDEEQRISRRINQRSKNGSIKKCESFKLTGIIYQDPEHWTIWINDVPYNTIGQNTSFSIDEVLPDRVIITDLCGDTIVLRVE